MAAHTHIQCMYMCHITIFIPLAAVFIGRTFMTIYLVRCDAIVGGGGDDLACKYGPQKRNILLCDSLHGISIRDEFNALGLTKNATK